MTWFDPGIYCKQNLKEEHKKALGKCESVCNDVIYYAQMEYEGNLVEEGSKTLAAIKKEIVADFVKYLRFNLGDILQNECINLIDNYEEPVESIYDPETFDYRPEDDEIED